MEGAFKMSGLRRWCLIASISLRHVCHRHGSEPIPENQCPLEPLRRLDRVAGKPSKCYSVLTAQNPQCKVRNTRIIGDRPVAVDFLQTRRTVNRRGGKIPRTIEGH